MRELARLNPGLCVITSRLEIDQLKDIPSEVLFLDRLPTDAGVHYLKLLGDLKLLGAHGTEQELRDAVDDFKGHALALTLLGSYLEIVYAGEMRSRNEIGPLTADPELGGHARRVLESYEQWFEGQPELHILRLLALFDRPATRAALNALRAQPAMAGLTENLSSLQDRRWQFAIKNLRKARLLDPFDSSAPDNFDCHPMIRAYFAEKMKHLLPGTWKQAHQRLYEYYRSSTDEFPTTMAGITRLYSAIAHGCEAGLFESAFQEYIGYAFSRAQSSSVQES